MTTNFDSIKIINGLSRARIQPYLALHATKNDDNAIKCYIALQEISSHFFVILQLLEITLRNNINEAFLTHTKNSKWYESYPTSTESIDMVANAKKKATKDFKHKTVSYNDDDVICRLTFGFWVYLFESRYRGDQFWQKNIDHIFQGRNKKKLSYLFSEFQKANTLRNRLYHHEPIWKDKKNKNMRLRDAIKILESKYNDILSLLEYCSPNKRLLISEFDLPNKFKICCEKYKT